jgi:hypothetical protein
LGYELGGYRDPYSRFGQLTYEAWRAARLVVDTGIHYYGWSRQQAIDFMKNNTALSEQNIAVEVDRYAAWPAQALAYKIGQLEILKLRREAEEALGDRFDIRAFHDHLLAEGSLTLSILKRRMTDWTEAQKRRLEKEGTSAGAMDGRRNLMARRQRSPLGRVYGRIKGHRTRGIVLQVRDEAGRRRSGGLLNGIPRS